MNKNQQPIIVSPQTELTNGITPKFGHIRFQFPDVQNAKFLAMSEFVKSLGGAVICVEPGGANDLLNYGGAAGALYSPGRVKSPAVGEGVVVDPASPNHPVKNPCI